ncbi:baseplate assembly protein [Sphingomonas desiccabilis]|uniref:Baseplate assembly protein n=1 Tax=Sphingomonas desiccabilis TaxID=429134 RepID=A0A4Q2J0I9_9SPHN|nr:baseplate J/gp47 family protein [Sphingomonas desiccabilis]MBB3910531.1 phage-related baseplate assembly protein [Sphingomonas desiccabilis]RXZ35170.1 baseplate assembly protein [Sphingomonas desiccabilis]
MSTAPASSNAIDLSRFPAPTIVEQLTFEQILAELVESLRARLPAFDALVESDPVVKLLQVVAYRELLLRQGANDAARQLMVAYALGANLDHLAALVGVTRLPNEADDTLRQRAVLGPEGFSVAGPELAYIYHAKSADPGVLDASAISPAPGEVRVTVLSREGDGAASAALLDAVRERVNAREVRPLGDLVTVASAEIRTFAVHATLYTFAGPDRSLVLTAAREQLDRYLAECRLLGRDVTMSGLYAALTVPGVQRVVLAAPTADVVCDYTQAAWCTDIVIAHGGYDA